MDNNRTINRTLINDQCIVEIGEKDDFRKYNFWRNKLRFVQEIYKFEYCKIYIIYASDITHTHTHPHKFARIYVYRASRYYCTNN